jgi:ribosome-associated toxin RatA of RatAB toxin-antitoxin module
MAKKKKNADFQKVKLKVGRKIQRATNETKAQIKVKAINIRSQFRQGLVQTENTNKTVVKHIDIKVCDCHFTKLTMFSWFNIAVTLRVC